MRGQAGRRDAQGQEEVPPGWEGVSWTRWRVKGLVRTGATPQLGLTPLGLSGWGMVTTSLIIPSYVCLYAHSCVLWEGGQEGLSHLCPAPTQQRAGLSTINIE